jgi:hypothetical protein
LPFIVHGSLFAAVRKRSHKNWHIQYFPSS